MHNDTTSTQVKAVLYNRSGWPARSSQTLSFRYYVNLSEVFAKGFTEKDIQVTAAYNEGASLSPLKYMTHQAASILQKSILRA